MKPWDGLSMHMLLWDLWFEKNGLVFLLRLDYGEGKLIYSTTVTKLRDNGVLNQC